MIGDHIQIEKGACDRCNDTQNTEKYDYSLLIIFDTKEGACSRNTNQKEQWAYCVSSLLIISTCQVALGKRRM